MSRNGMVVPFLDLGATYRALQTELDDAMQRVMRSGWYLLGGELAAFEAEFATYTQSSHCLGVANGLDALELGLRALGVGPGDEVIVPSNTYIATWLATTAVGATVVPVEPDERTYNLDPSRISAAITARTRVILPVHLYGQPADMTSIMSIAREHGIRVLEDAAQAHGARCGDRRIGGIGDITAWSFYPSKNLGAFGDAGAVTTDDAELADRVRVLRNYGARTKYLNEVRGINSRMEELHAGMLRVKLGVLDQWNAVRAQHAKRYSEGLEGSGLILPVVPEWAQPVWHLYVVRSAQRDRLQQHLKSRGVETLVHYPIPPHLQAAYADACMSAGSFPISERLHEEVLSLPIGPHLTEEQTQYVVSCIRDA